MAGRCIRLEPFRPRSHGERLFASIAGPADAPLWRYLPISTPQSAAALADFFEARRACRRDPWVTLALVDPQTDAVRGAASYMRIRPEHGSAEIGCVIFGRRLQRTPGATEAVYLMARHLFDDLGYRRYEWKCHNANEASKRAAERFGFAFEGVFRNDMVMKGENRDTAWFSITDEEWPSVREAFEAWLAPENFDEAGAQRRPLAAYRRA